MAKKSASSTTVMSKSKTRKGIHSKSKTSSTKTSKNYKKKYSGQGR
jgi:hypothetical protein